MLQVTSEPIDWIDLVIRIEFLLRGELNKKKPVFMFMFTCESVYVCV